MIDRTVYMVLPWTCKVATPERFILACVKFSATNLADPINRSSTMCSASRYPRVGDKSLVPTSPGRAFTFDCG